MVKHEQTARLRAIGINARDIAAALGVSANAVLTGFTRGAAHYEVIIDLLERMTPDQRRAWVEGRRSDMRDEQR